MLLLTLLLSIAAVFIADGARERAVRELERLQTRMAELPRTTTLLRDSGSQRRIAEQSAPPPP